MEVGRKRINGSKFHRATYPGASISAANREILAAVLQNPPYMSRQIRFLGSPKIDLINVSVTQVKYWVTQR